MDRTDPLPSDEAEPLNIRQPRASAEDVELRDQPYYATRSPSPSLASTSHHSGQSEGPAPTYVLAGSPQQQHLEVNIEDQGPSHQTKTYISGNYVLNQWLWELFSIAAAALALMAIVVTLALHRERTLPKWPSAITINALIAVFTAILKACLMMPIAECIGQLKWLWYHNSRPLRSMEQWDLASRGPWGSLLLIFTLKSRGLVVLGAVLTVIATAVDPFTQQIVQFYSCPQVAGGERGAIPLSNSYTNSLVDEVTGYWDPQMHSTIYMGLLAPPATTSASLQFECRTGNCTFPSTEDGATFRSLALESQCIDIGNEITFSTVSKNWSSGTFYATDTIASASLPRYNLSFATHVWKNAPLEEPQLMQTGSEFASQALDDTNHARWPSPFLLRVSYFMRKARQLPEPQYTSAIECEFYPAVQTYSANIRNGVLVEQIWDTQRMDVWPLSSIFSSYALLIVKRAIREGKWHECTSSSKLSTEHNLPVNVSLNISSEMQNDYYEPTVATSLDQNSRASPFNNITWWPQDCVYFLGPQAGTSISEAIYSILGSETVQFSGEKRGTPWGLKIWNDGDTTVEATQAIMDGVARSVTARLRQGDGISMNASPVYGKVWETQTCVHVNWSWLGLPAGLLILTIVFLCLTIFKTRSKQARVWKNSIFAVLFSGIDQEAGIAAGPVVSLEEMKAAADKATVRLEDTKEGFRLVSQA